MDPEYGDHLVAGTQQFGFEMQPDGSYGFFVSGVARMDNSIVEPLAFRGNFGNVFEGSEKFMGKFSNKSSRID